MSKRRKTEEHAEMSLCDLNDDCFHIICSYLNQVEQFYVLAVCDRLTRTNIIKEIIWDDFFDVLKDQQMELIFSAYSPNLKLIEYQSIDDRLFSINLEKLNRISNNWCPNVPIKISSWNLTDELVELISSVTQLTRLNIFSNEMTGKHLDKLKNLTHLTLDYCSNIESDHLIKICQSNKLKTLGIAGCEKLNDIAIETIFATQSDLEELHIGNIAASNLAEMWRLKALRSLTLQGDKCVEIFCNIAHLLAEQLETLVIWYKEPSMDSYRMETLKLPNLKYLHLTRYGHTNDEFLDEIAVNCTRLKSLVVTGESLISDLGVINFIKKSENLRELYLNGWLDFDKTVLQRIAAIIEKRQSKPIVISVRGTEMDLSFLQTAMYEKSKKYITLILDYPPEEHSDFDEEEHSLKVAYGYEHF